MMKLTLFSTYILRIVIPTIVFLLCANGLYAADATTDKRMSAAVIRITVTGTTEDYGSILEDLLSARLYEKKVFLVMDRTQIEKIARRAGFTNFDVSDRIILADRGKTLAVDKIIAGTAVKNGAGLHITVRCVDTRSSAIDIIVNTDVSDDKELPGAIAELTEKISRYYSGLALLSGDFDFTVGVSRFFPVGPYSEYLNASFGGFVNCNVNNVFTRYTGFHAVSGFSIFNPKTDRYRSFTQFFLLGGIAGHFRPAESIGISPRLSAGPVITRLDYDLDGRRTSSGFDYKIKYCKNLCVLFEAELSLYVYDRWMLSVSPGFMTIPDSENSGRLFTVAAGIKTLL